MPDPGSLLGYVDIEKCRHDTGVRDALVEALDIYITKRGYLPGTSVGGFSITVKYTATGYRVAVWNGLDEK
jgi:hypothetical protein